MTGTIFELKRFAVHDGPGIRSTLFLKGCPLHCPWCQNPEGMQVQIGLWHAPASCVHCGSCAAVCPEGAITLEDSVRINRVACIRCGKCIDICPAAALSMDGSSVSFDEAAAMLMRDLPFYDEGGVTLSGGEVLSQWQFALEILKICRAQGVDTAIETCLWAEEEVIRRFIPLTNHFLVDIKYIDAGEHKRILGVDNERILRNYELLVRSGADVLVRTPLIPGFTATEENIRGIARYLAGVNPDARYELLNFNPLCRSKYAALRRDYPVEGSPLRADEMEEFYVILREEGIRNIVRE